MYDWKEKKQLISLLLVQLSSKLSKSGDQSIGSIFCEAVWLSFHFDETVFLENRDKKPNRVGSWGGFQAALRDSMEETEMS